MTPYFEYIENITIPVMKKLLLPLLFCAPFWVVSQTVDSTAIRQVDSLIQLARDLTGKNNLGKALETIAVAEKIALEKLGWESAAYGSCCYIHGRMLDSKRNYPEAEKWYLESKAIREKAVGKEHPDYLASLNNLAGMYSNTGQYEKAEALYIESMTIRGKMVGKENSEYAGSLIDLANTYERMGQFDKAEPLFLEAKAIFEVHLNNRNHLFYLYCLNGLGILYSEKGQYKKAEPLYLEAKAIRENMLGKEHPDYAGSLINLGSLYRKMGLYEKAEPLYLEAKEIFEVRMNNPYHPFYMNCLNGLALLYTDLGRYEKAEPLYLKCIPILEKVLGQKHPNYAGTLINLGGLYRIMGQYEKAESYFLQAKDVFENRLNNRTHIFYKNCLTNLANLYYDMGQYEKAELMYKEDRAISEKTLGKEHPDYALSLSNLAQLYQMIGQYDKAEPLFLEAKVIYEKVLGKENPEYAGSLLNLAQLCVNIGQYEKAESLFLEAKAIREKMQGEEHPRYAENLTNLALLYMTIGRHEQAEPLLLKAKAICEKVLGKENLDYTASLINLANLYFAIGRFDKAEPLFLELSTVNRSLMEKALRHLSERELSNYLNKFVQSQNQTLSFTQVSGSKKVTPVCYDNSLFYKGIMLNAANQIKRLALADSSATKKYETLKSFERRLANEYSKPTAERDSAKVAELEENANDLEKDLARTVAGFGDALRQVNWQDVQQKLKADEAAIEFVHYHYSDKKETDSTMYAALLLRPGFDQPKFIPLFEEKQLDSLLKTSGERRADYVSTLYTIAERGAKPLGKPEKSLYELFWQPLEHDLTGVKTIYFSPSGLLYRLNPGAIPISEEETLADRYRLVEMGSTRQLVVGSPLFAAHSQDAMLFGGVQYEMDSLAMAAANVEYGSETVASRGELSFSQVDSTGRGGTWGYLKWTEKEVAAVEPILTGSGFRATLRGGFAATEEAFKSIGKSRPSPSVLHLATHGFFFPDPGGGMRNTEYGMRNGEEPVFKISDHPMIRSGLILAGGNYAWATGKPLKPGMEDGILTAYEISQMNLSNTELVVLSACETGLGDIQGNEGVYGLQRAFKIAGAKYLIMSLWQVPDKQTSLLMTTFYKKWLEEKMAIPEAFRAAQKELRDAGLDPYQWAGFVLVE